MRKNFFRKICLIFFSSAFFISSASAAGLSKFPQQIKKQCRGGKAKLYDECSDQTKIFTKALKRARSEGKTLLVSYGAEWCIWCHVFDAHIEGGKSKFRYVFASPDAPEKKYQETLYEKEKHDVTAQAKALANYVSSNFVIAHIENYYSPNGHAVLENTGAGAHFQGGIPFIFVVNRNGKYAGRLNSDRVETRRDFFDWYRGYDRKKLMSELARLKTSARK